MSAKRRKNFKLSVTMKQEAREALILLEGSGLTLPDCARIALGKDTVASIETSIEPFLNCALTPSG